VPLALKKQQTNDKQENYVSKYIMGFDFQNGDIYKNKHYKVKIIVPELSIRYKLYVFNKLKHGAKNL
jgi:hypothetical protein